MIRRKALASTGVSRSSSESLDMVIAYMPLESSSATMAAPGMARRRARRANHQPKCFRQYSRGWRSSSLATPLRSSIADW